MRNVQNCKWHWLFLYKGIYSVVFHMPSHKNFNTQLILLVTRSYEQLVDQKYKYGKRYRNTSHHGFLPFWLGHLNSKWVSVIYKNTRLTLYKHCTVRQSLQCRVYTIAIEVIIFKANHAIIEWKEILNRDSFALF